MGQKSSPSSSPSSGKRSIAIAVVIALVAMLLWFAAFPVAAGETQGKARPMSREQFSKEVGNRHWNFGGTGVGDTWYLAEGSTAWGFRDHIIIENPNNSEVTAEMTFMLDDGSTVVKDTTVAAESSLNVDAEPLVGNRDFSTKVVAMGGEDIAVSRVMLLNYYQQCMIHSSIGVEEPAPEWWLAEGSTGGDFETWVLVQNPQSKPVLVGLFYDTPSGPVEGPELTLPANSRHTFNVADTLPNEYSVSTMVEASDPVIAERAMYWNNRKGGHESVGVSSPGKLWYLPEGSTGGDFETWVLVQNASDTTANVKMSFQTDAGPRPGPSFAMKPGTRQTFRVSDYVPNTYSVSTTVTADQEVVAERAMYWGNRIEGHDSIGYQDAHKYFLLPYGQCGPDSSFPGSNWETWTLIQNPTASDIVCRVYYLPQYGGKIYQVDVLVPAHSRKSVNMADSLPPEGGLAGIIVTAHSGGTTILAEGSSYAAINGTRFCGCDSIGGFDDD